MRPLDGGNRKELRAGNHLHYTPKTAPHGWGTWKTQWGLSCSVQQGAPTRGVLQKGSRKTVLQSVLCKWFHQRFHRWGLPTRIPQISRARGSSKGGPQIWVPKGRPRSRVHLVKSKQGFPQKRTSVVSKVPQTGGITRSSNKRAPRTCHIVSQERYIKGYQMWVHERGDLQK
jgi:hypothetical protein